jgi:DnaK suppressor protein
MEPKTKYSDDELKQFKELLLSKIKAEKEELKQLSLSLKSTNDNHAGRGDSTSDAEKESLNQLMGRLLNLIKLQELALVRIENKTYGICRETGDLIPKERLMSVPHTTMTFKAKLAEVG